jgi:hypothetical protein
MSGPDQRYGTARAAIVIAVAYALVLQAFALALAAPSRAGYAPGGWTHVLCLQSGEASAPLDLPDSGQHSDGCCLQGCAGTSFAATPPQSGSGPDPRPKISPAARGSANAVVRPLGAGPPLGARAPPSA